MRGRISRARMAGRRSLAIPKAQQGIFPLGQSGLDVVAAGGFYER
jgi:hypothetical protein